MNKLHSILAYICIAYPLKNELSKARITKLVYLADWYSSLLNDKQMTDIQWTFNHYGPYVSDVIESAQQREDFQIDHQLNSYGSTKDVLCFSGNESAIDLTNKERSIIDAIINKTKGFYFNEFIDYVYSTYPVSSSERYANLDLVSLARQYKQKEVS
ncbi:Panacea domain-containing protein [Cobetia sp. 3AK]|uniref:Panacea domain-containing protein n=1 Tax=Cobetia sp. 3AK TaxID=3040020 RepID=UPI00244C893C|nr:Panacea domain-containing protein [Cobetia sp. 3AK]MDH2372895.1 Panacea domain-containing protein [Cobetia sp. 3AK]